MRALALCAALVALAACRRSKPVADEVPEPAAVGAGACERAVEVFDGSLAVSRSDYVHPVARGDDYVDEPIAGLERVVSKAAQLRFTLDYPFEKPFAGVITGELTLRRIFDAIRSGFRHMYQGTTEREIPGMANRDVTGPYGQASHTIDDLVIERIDLCADDTLSIEIGS